MKIILLALIALTVVGCAPSSAKAKLSPDDKKRNDLATVCQGVLGGRGYHDLDIFWSQVRTGKLKTFYTATVPFTAKNRLGLVVKRKAVCTAKIPSGKFSIKIR